MSTIPQSQVIALSDIGEKRLIAEYIKPLFNPTGSLDLDPA